MRLEITMKFRVKKDADKADKMGIEEIYLRAVAQKAKDLAELIGRGKFEVETTYERPAENRLLVKKSKKEK